ncbi:hypothetical protein [Niallia taxi]|uniref:hypothetical protein n=1 Tax=Niallia taxi TaxID=2499688 RepID=UPI0015F46D92|nr:hypothetical protein [Niallia taxi]
MLDWIFEIGMFAFLAYVVGFVILICFIDGLLTELKASRLKRKSDAVLYKKERDKAKIEVEKAAVELKALKRQVERSSVEPVVTQTRTQRYHSNEEEPFGFPGMFDDMDDSETPFSSAYSTEEDADNGFPSTFDDEILEDPYVPTYEATQKPKVENTQNPINPARHSEPPVQESDMEDNQVSEPDDFMLQQLKSLQQMMNQSPEQGVVENTKRQPQTTKKPVQQPKKQVKKVEPVMTPPPVDESDYATESEYGENVSANYYDELVRDNGYYNSLTPPAVNAELPEKKAWEKLYGPYFAGMITTTIAKGGAGLQTILGRVSKKNNSYYLTYKGLSIRLHFVNNEIKSLLPQSGNVGVILSGEFSGEEIFSVEGVTIPERIDHQERSYGAM